MQVVNVYAIKDERTVIGIYKQQNLTDPDAIYSKKTELIASFNVMKYLGWFFVVLGIPALFFLIGFMLVPGGAFMIYFSKKKSNLIETATNNYCKSLGIATA